jgi:uncharacterized protein
VPVNGASRRVVLVALHDVEPRALSRCREIRSWLAERGADQVTLLVIPAPHERPFAADSPELVAWLIGRVAGGDAIAQHGLTHRRHRRTHGPRGALAHLQGGTAAEFPGLDADATSASVRLGRVLLREAGLPPRGFVAPGYAYTRPLRRTVRDSFEWSADLWGVQVGGRRVHAPALCLGASSALKRGVSPAVVRAAGRSPGRLMRIDVHPADFDHDRNVAALDALLRRADGRRTITYDDLAA